MSLLLYPRPELARKVAALVMGAGMLMGTPPGLFLAAPRRTGKSTFLQHDLKPELEAQGCLVLYVDLWKNIDEDPARLIAHLIAHSLAEHQGLIARTAAAVGLTKVRIHGVEFSLDAVGRDAGASLTEALQELRDAAGKPIALIVDEAQHVVRVDGKMSVMFALKAARDAMNLAGLNLMLVMSGSDRDKLLRLVHSNAAPFLGAGIHELPHLGRDYTDYIAGLLAVSKPQLDVDNDRLWQTFGTFAFRPEFFMKAINDLTGPLSELRDDFHDRLDAAADRFKADRYEAFRSQYLGLTPLQRAMLAWLMRETPEPKMFSQAALGFYTALVGKEVSPGSARDALEQIRNLDPPIVWRSDRGDYALEDTGMLDWYQALDAAGAWPPG